MYSGVSCATDEGNCTLILTFMGLSDITRMRPSGGSQTYFFIYTFGYFYSIRQWNHQVINFLHNFLQPHGSSLGIVELYS
ncbi:hypothetical protein ACN38_g10648 [Penicillium nordicum]|uniref:Uncharacterized protein n=1 Tax=Penicillium nordicum TaxID=229535 RepID=A0A0M8P030_9EURO|nr:hypothetical protein ACN38_g10648 [Penicillium nordicum]